MALFSSQRLTNRIKLFALILVLLIGVAVVRWDHWFEKRVMVVEPHRLVRGAWQSCEMLEQILDREGIRTIVTLTAINRDDPKYLEQERALRGRKVDWVIIPMRGSTGTVDQMAEAADLLASAERQPVFFHCVAGHHRTSLTHAAYLIRHRGFSAQEAWSVVSRLPWADPEQDSRDLRRIEEFALWNQTHPPQSLATTTTAKHP